MTARGWGAARRRAAAGLVNARRRSAGTPATPTSGGHSRRTNRRNTHSVGGRAGRGHPPNHHPRRTANTPDRPRTLGENGRACTAKRTTARASTARARTAGSTAGRTRKRKKTTAGTQTGARHAPGSDGSVGPPPHRGGTDRHRPPRASTQSGPGGKGTQRQTAKPRTRGRSRRKKTASGRGEGGEGPPYRSPEGGADSAPARGGRGCDPRSHPRTGRWWRRAARPVADHKRGDAIGLDCANYAIQ